MSFYYSYNILEHTIFINEEKQRIVSINLKPIASQMKETSLIKEAHQELVEYLNGKRKEFSFKYESEGSQFQKEVWDVIRKIPFGETLTYKDIAKIINRPKAFRAIGTACNKNPLLFVIPCHRVVAINNKTHNYKLGAENKKKLLNLEKKIS